MREDIRFVLKLWRDGRDAGAWRASLRDLRSAHTHVFRSIGACCSYLQERAVDLDVGFDLDTQKEAS